MNERFKRHRLLYALAFGVGEISLLASCSGSGADTSPPNETEAQFMRDANAVVIGHGEVRDVPKIKPDLKGKYNELHTVNESTDLDDNHDNVLTFKPNRYEGGRGKQSDGVCDDLRVTEETAYVLAVDNSDYPARVEFDLDGKHVHICYDPTNSPGTVAVWGSNEPR